MGLETYSVENSGSPFYPFLGERFMVGIIIPSIFFSFTFLSLFLFSVFWQPASSTHLCVCVYVYMCVCVLLQVLIIKDFEETNSLP